MLWITVPKTASLWVTRRVRSLFSVCIVESDRVQREIELSIVQKWLSTELSNGRIHAFICWRNLKCAGDGRVEPAVAVTFDASVTSWLACLSRGPKARICIISHMRTRMLHQAWDASPWSWCISWYSHHLYTSLHSHTRHQTVLRLTIQVHMQQWQIAGGEWKFVNESIRITQCISKHSPILSCSFDGVLKTCRSLG